jgi:hypothetical protein
MPLINGAHSIVYSTDADADGAFFATSSGLPAVDVGHGWLIRTMDTSQGARRTFAHKGSARVFCRAEVHLDRGEGTFA